MRILPIMKKLYTLLEPEYNPTIVFYVDDFIIEYYDDYFSTYNKGGLKSE